MKHAVKLIAAAAAIVLVGLFVVRTRSTSESVVPAVVADGSLAAAPSQLAPIVESNSVISQSDSRIEVESAELTHGPIDIHGRVVDEAGTPIELFALAATRLDVGNYVVDERKWPLELHTNGEFELTNLTPGRWAIEPQVDGLKVEDSLQFKATTEDRVDFVMFRIGVVRVFVFDTQRTPLVDAVLSIDGEQRDIRMNRSGVFEFQLEPGDHSIRARSHGFLDNRHELVHVDPRFPVGDVMFTLFRGATLRGTLSKVSGEQLANWTVSRSWKGNPSTTADAAGQFELTGIEAGQLELFIRPPSAVVREGRTLMRTSSEIADEGRTFVTALELREGEIKEVALRLARERSVRVVGHLTLHEQLETGGLAFTPCDGLVSTAESFGTQAYPDGAFAVTLPTLGRFRIEIVGTIHGGKGVRLDAGVIDVPDQDVFELKLDL